MGTIAQSDMRDTEHITTVQCEDGYQLVYRVWPVRGERSGTVVLVNGLMSHSVWFRAVACVLRELDLHVVGADRRGSGLNQSGRGDAPSRQILVSDLHTIIGNEHRKGPLWLLGWCWGALPAVNAALELGSRLSGLILLAPGLFPAQTIRKAAKQAGDACSNSDPRSPTLASPLTCDMFSDREDIREFIIKDEFAQHAFSPRFFSISREMSIIAIARLRQLAIPVLLLMAAQDETIDMEQTINSFERVQAVTLNVLPGHHAMQLEAPREVAARILKWASTNVS